MVNTVRIGKRGFWDGLGRAHWNAVAVYVHQQKTWVLCTNRVVGEKAWSSNTKEENLCLPFLPGVVPQSLNQDLSLGG